MTARGTTKNTKKKNKPTRVSVLSPATMTKQQSSLYACNRDNEMMTKAKVSFFLFLSISFLSFFSICVCGVCLDDRRGRDAITADKSVLVVVVAATILGSRRSGQQLMAHGPARGQQGQVATKPIL